MWLKNFYDLVLGRGKMDITRRVLRFFLLVSVITLVLSSTLALVGILTTEDKMRAMGQYLGESTREKVTNWVLEREKDYLEQLVHEKVILTDSAILESVSGDSKILAENIEDILLSQEKYSPKELIRPQSIEDG